MKSMKSSLASLNTSNLPPSVLWIIIWVSTITYKTPTPNPIIEAKNVWGERNMENMLKTNEVINEPKKMY